MPLTFAADNPRILVFDSGVGGLSIVREIHKKLPYAPLVYASDNGFFPYGTKGEAELIERVDQVFRKILASQHIDIIVVACNNNNIKILASQHIDIIVVACNTASTLALPHIRSNFAQPVVGVVPAIKPAAALSKTQVIGLLATPATVARPYTHNLIREYAPNVEVISVGSSELVQLAEEKLRGKPVSSNSLQPILAPFFSHPNAAKMDTLVLACTHFPLLREELAAQFPPHIALIDSGEAIARRVVYLLEDHVFIEKAPVYQAVFTQSSPAVEALRPHLKPFGIEQLAILPV